MFISVLQHVRTGQVRSRQVDISRMATNLLAPNGMNYTQQFGGVALSGAVQPYKIKSGYGTRINKGDIVSTGTSGNQGYVTIPADNTAPFLGVFVAVYPYYDTNMAATAHGLNGAYITGAAPTGDIDCAVISDLSAVFMVQGVGGPYTTSMRGLNVQWTTGSNAVTTGNGVNGISSLSVNLSTVATTNTFPLRIIGVSGVVGGPQDPTATNPFVLVQFNPGALEALVSTGV